MNKVTRSAVEILANRPKGPALSIYLPTHRQPTPPHLQEDQTRLKNLLRQGIDAWQTHTGAPMANEMQKSLDSLLISTPFWQETTEGLALFISADGIQTYHLPIETEPHVNMGDEFDITPLLIVLEYDQPYYLLRISMHDPSLLRGDAYGLEPMAINFPSSLEEALNIDEMFANSNTIRTNGGPAGASNTTSPHGAGDSNDAGREERLQYFRIIDHTIASSPDYDSTQPLLIAGTDSEAGDYCKISRLSGVVTAHIQGNHSATPLRQLHEQAWPIVCQHVVDERTKRAVKKFQEATGNFKSSDDSQSIADAAGQGRVDTLFVRMIRKTTDSVSDAVRGAVPIITFSSDSEQAYLRDLIQKVFTQGGRILGLDSDLMPAKVPVAAIYRY